MFNTKFRNGQGLTAYSFLCGYIQRVESKVSGEEIRIDLWLEHGCWHVRAHNYDSVGRIEWVSEENLTDARTQWKRLVKQLFGEYISTAKADKRYTVAREFHGESEPSWVVRFEGNWVNHSDNAEMAWIKAAEHKKENSPKELA